MAVYLFLILPKVSHPQKIMATPLLVDTALQMSKLACRLTETVYEPMKACYRLIIKISRKIVRSSLRIIRIDPQVATIFWPAARKGKMLRIPQKTGSVHFPAMTSHCLGVSFLVENVKVHKRLVPEDF